MDDTIYLAKPTTKQPIIAEDKLVKGDTYIGQVRDTLYVFGWWDGQFFHIPTYKFGLYMETHIDYKNFMPQNHVCFA
jgi:hypothetical protein